MKIELYPQLSIHEIGQRDNQEDAIVQWDNRLFILCDGMGGHEKGEVASQTVCQSLATWFENNITSDEPFTDNQLREALEYTYLQLDQYADGNLKQMGTTLTLLYINMQGVTAAHMGDSRIYHIRPNNGTLYQSRDHSLVFDLFQAGEITYEEMATFPQKNIVTRAMTPGEDNRMRPDIIHITDIQPNDYFYMCSDGMMEKMTNNELLTLFSADMDDKMKVGQLKMATNQNFDNHTAWIIHIKNAIKEENDDQFENEERTSRFNAINILPHPVYDAEDNDVVVVGGKEKSLFQKIIGLFK
jgi:protein phosphatase